MDLAYPRYAKEVCDAIVAKCLTGRPKTLEKAQAAFLLWVELEAAEVFLESMEQAVKNKVAKAVVPAIDVMFQALSEFGTKVVPPKKILKMLPELFDHPDQNVWASSKGLTLELCRWIGKEPVKSILFEKMRDTMKKELEAELANVSGIAKPTRKIRSEQEKQLEEEAVAETTGANTSEEAVADEVRDASFSVLTAIVKIVGMKPLERSLEKLDDVRKKKLSDMIGSVSDTALSSGTAPSTTSGAATSARGDSLSMKRSAASMLSGKKPVQAEAATKKSGRSKSTAAKKTDGGSQSKTSAAPEIEDIERVAATGDRAAFTFSIPKSESMGETQETHTMCTFPSNHEKGSSAGALSDDMVYLPKLTMGAIPRPYLSQGALTTAQLLNDFRNLQQIGKNIEFEWLRNHLSVLSDAINKERLCTMSPLKTLSAGKCFRGFIEVICQAHRELSRKVRTDNSKVHEKEHILLNLKQQEMAKDHESRWLRNFFWREQEWLRPKIEERVHEQQQMNSVNSQTPQCDKKGDRSVIDVEATKKHIYVNHMDGKLSLCVDTNHSGLLLKNSIGNDLGYSLENFTLRFGCRILDNEMSLNSHGICNNATLDLYPKMLGGCERDLTLTEFVGSGIALVSTIPIPHPYASNGTVNVQNLNTAGCKLAKSIVDEFVKTFQKGETCCGSIGIANFNVHLGRAVLTKPAKVGRNYDDWKGDCKQLASILHQIFTAVPLYMSDLLDTLDNVKRADMYLNWLNVYLQNHFAFVHSYNRSNVSNKITTMYESMTPNDQTAFRKILDGVNCKEWASSQVQNAQIFCATMNHKNNIKHRGGMGYSCFRFQRNFTKHASEEKQKNGVSRFSWTLLEYVSAYLLGNFVSRVIKDLLENNYPIVELLQSAAPS